MMDFDIELSKYMDENYCLSAEAIYSKLDNNYRVLVKALCGKTIKYEG